MNWEVIIKWLPKLAQGATLTLELVAIAVIAGLLLAIPLGVARSSKRWYVRSQDHVLLQKIDPELGLIPIDRPQAADREVDISE